MPLQLDSRGIGGRLLCLLVVCVAGGMACTASALANPPIYKDSSVNGKFVFFESDEQLVPGDTDFKRDIYERSFDPTVGEGGAYVTRQISVGPTGGNDAYNALFEAAAADGSKVFFTTEESLVAADTDRKADVYVRELVGGNGTTKLVSRGVAACQPGCGNGLFDAGFAGSGSDGNQVLIVTAEPLDPSADSDDSVDVYERDLLTGVTTLVSAGDSSCAPSCGNGAFNATLRGVSADGSRAFFATFEPLTEGDDDTALDIYARNLPGGPTTLVSAGDPACSPCGNSDTSAAVFAGSSTSGDKVFFTTDEDLVPADEDGANDVYQRAEGTTSLVSAGTELQPATFAAATANGGRVFFATAESLAGLADGNGANDVYMWQGGAPQLVTSGSCCGSTFGAITSDGGAVIFTTKEVLDGADADTSADIYERSVAGGPAVLVSRKDPACPSCGGGEATARFNGASADGSRVYFTSDEVLASQDFDLSDDIYLRDLGEEETILATPPPGLCQTSSCNTIFLDSSENADHMVFQTAEKLVAADEDWEPDIYERGYDAELGAEVTRLISTGNSSDLELGPQPPQLQGTNPGSPGESTTPLVIGTAREGSLIKIYPTASCSGEPLAAGTAEELASPGIAVTVGTGSTMSFWATAEAEGFTSLCSNPVSYTQQSAQPPGEPPSGDGSGSGGSSGSGGGTNDPPVKTHDGVAYIRPLTRITFGPAAKTRSARPVFRFTDATGQPGTRFRCKVDRRRWLSCSSPLKLKRMTRGRHVFQVKGVNAVGVGEERPVKRAFKVVPR